MEKEVKQQIVVMEKEGEKKEVLADSLGFYELEAQGYREIDRYTKNVNVYF